ncbi:MAG: cob(I)yrinic acid a,c-diamide adenosyltransferase [Patescibacteria group bacterium]
MSLTVEPSKSTGLIQVFTGNGKGKTTAALGTAMRAIAKGWRVAFVTFDKGGTHYAEREVLADRFDDLVDVYPTGLDRIHPITNKFRFGVTEEDRAEAERGLDIVRDLFAKGEHQLIILDEINSTTDLGMLHVDRVVEVIKKKPDNVELILTGRNCPQAFIDLADLVSDVQLVKHYFYQGVKAREGLDF